MGYKSGDLSCCFLTLTAKTQGIEGEELQDVSRIDEIKAKLSETDPKYILFSYSKANVIEYCTSIGLDFYSKAEVTSINDFNAEYMDYHIFPIREKKEQFAMPKAPKSRRKSKSKKRK